MRSYDVTWTITIDADSARQAADLAREIQRDPESSAVVFDIEGESIDLDEK